MLVLLIEDETDLRDLAQVVLEEAGHVVVAAPDGRKALRLLERIQPELIVTDMMMPVMDGFGFLEAYAASGGRAALLAMSAFPPYLEKALAMGVDAVLPKPFTASALVAAVDTAMTEHGERRDARPANVMLPPANDAHAQLQAEPVVEAARVAAIRHLRLDEPTPEERLKDFVAEVARHFGVAIGLLNVVDAEDTYSTASCGIEPPELGKSAGSARADWFCTHAVAARAALVVQDTSRNPYFRDNPIVKKRGLRFYAGVPLITRHGDAVGTLCILDQKAASFTHSDLELLSLFANRIVCALEWRERRREPSIPESTFRFLHFYDDQLGTFGSGAFGSIAAVEAARATERHKRLAGVALAVPHRRLGAIVEALADARQGSIVGRLGHARLGWLVPGVTAVEARQMALDVAGAYAFAESVQLERVPGVTHALLARAASALGEAGLA